jgi:hypothetical protein
VKEKMMVDNLSGDDQTANSRESNTTIKQEQEFVRVVSTSAQVSAKHGDAGWMKKNKRPITAPKII